MLLSPADDTREKGVASSPRHVSFFSEIKGYPTRSTCRIPYYKLTALDVAARARSRRFGNLTQLGIVYAYMLALAPLPQH
jgi:hypothetical protein